MILFTALCDRVAQILGLKGDTDSLDVRRSKAIGIIAHPIRTIALLAEYEGRNVTEPPEPTEAYRETGVRCGPAPDGAWRSVDDQEPATADAPLPNPPASASLEPSSDPEQARLIDSPTFTHPASDPLDEVSPIGDQGGADAASGLSTSSGTVPEPPPGPGLDCGVQRPASQLTSTWDEPAPVQPEAPVAPGGYAAPKAPAASVLPEPESPVGAGLLLNPAEAPVITETDLHPVDIDPYLPVNYAAEFQKILDRYRINPRELLPKTVVYLHVDRDTLAGNSGAVRVEDVGPITAAQFKHWIRGKHLTVTPVIDPDNTPAVDGYEASDRLKDALRMITPAEAFPYGTSTGRNLDHDHVDPYRPPPAGPPGQTSLGNLNRLGRRFHRYKTHGGWQVRMPEPGTTIWRSPNGWYFLTNQAGTHPLGNGDYAHTIWDTMINDFTATRYPDEEEDADEELAG